MDFISIGEMVIDFLPGTEEGSYIRNAGGAPANVAIAAARNGVSAGIYCKVGADDFGRFLLETLCTNGVTPLSEKLCEEAITTMAFVTLTGENERSFTFARKPGADMMLDPSEIREEDLRNCRILQAGSCSLSAGAAGEATVYAMRRTHELGKMVSFDVNYRNLMWQDDKNACIAAVQKVLLFVDFLKISEEELDFVGGRENILQVMKENHIAVVVLTLGSKGAEVFFEEGSRLVPGYRCGTVRDTTGAGDAFWGGFLSCLLLEGVNTTEDLSEELLWNAVNYGNVSGCLAVTEKGAIASLPTREQILEYLKKTV